MEKIAVIVNRIANSISSLVLFVIMCITVIDVSGRYLFNKPLSGTIEIVELALVLIVYLAFGQVEMSEMHVNIDTLYELFPKKLKLIVYEFGSVISFATITLMSYQLMLYAGRMKAGMDTTGVLYIPVYPVIYIASIGGFCYSIAILGNMAKHFRGRDKA